MILMDIHVLSILLTIQYEFIELLVLIQGSGGTIGGESANVSHTSLIVLKNSGFFNNSSQIYEYNL
ncbi:hypothetical protein [Bacillus sp. FJAT-44742]|uniref:hypothetical protein n=1 Tax=Bacillus sp. FJAT-44742 TaxID=2014005 RepID=UPI000C24510F|nr:hypothetical protein [Bacillus sp. FJAT-44742]